MTRDQEPDEPRCRIRRMIQAMERDIADSRWYMRMLRETAARPVNIPPSFESNGLPAREGLPPQDGNVDIASLEFDAKAHAPGPLRRDQCAP